MKHISAYIMKLQSDIKVANPMQAGRAHYAYFMKVIFMMYKTLNLILMLFHSREKIRLFLKL